MTARNTARHTAKNTTSTGPLTMLLRQLRSDYLFLILLATLLALTAHAPARITGYVSLVDWPTIAALAGLLTLTKALELSGALARLGHALVERLASERAVAIGLVLAAALLSMVLTNDVALFVVVPLTLGVCRLSKMKPTRLIVFEALAVNAGSMLTPIGNPQNLFLWQLSGVSFGAFVRTMAPLVGLLMTLLLVLAALAFSGRAVTQSEQGAPAAQGALDRPLMAVALLLYPVFLIATDVHFAGWALAGVLLVFIVMRRAVLAEVDWGLLLVFVLMFIDLRLIADLAVVKAAMARLGLGQAPHLYWASIAASQVVSNVPAAIALAEYSKDWRVMAYGVNVGGFGLMIGSLANLIALRLGRDRAAWWAFHLFSLPFLAIAALAGQWLLFGLGD